MAAGGGAPFAGVRRLHDDGEPPEAGSLLGGQCYGMVPGDARWPGVEALDAPLLWPSRGCIDAWGGRPVLGSGQAGPARWRHDGQWLMGAIDLDEDATPAGSLEALAQRLYAALFDVLRQTGFPHVLRLWNYLPDINADGGGLERYRQFNVGRQRAFLEAGRAAFDGAPAACAVGIGGRALRLRFLAGKRAPVAVENPRQVSAYHYPAAYGPRSPTFSRAAWLPVQEDAALLLVSGTASIVGAESRHAGDVAGQVGETVANLRALVDAACRSSGAAFRLDDLDGVAFVRHAADAAAVRAVLARELAPEARLARSLVMVRADICRADLLVEIEAHGVARLRSPRA